MSDRIFNRFSSRGKIHCAFVSDYSGSDTKDPEKILSIVRRKGPYCPMMFFSRESLLSVVGTDKEESFFYSLLNKINGKEIAFVFKRGGGLFAHEKAIAELCAEEVAKGMSHEDALSKVLAESGASYLIGAYEWNRAFEELELEDQYLYRIGELVA